MQTSENLPATRKQWQVSAPAVQGGVAWTHVSPVIGFPVQAAAEHAHAGGAPAAGQVHAVAPYTQERPCSPVHAVVLVGWVSGHAEQIHVLIVPMFMHRHWTGP